MSQSTSYISSSGINGQGLFTNQTFHKGEIILDNIFPHKDLNERLYEPIHAELFNRYISKEGSKINHCSKSYNSQVYTDDYKKYQLIATKDISKNIEITSNYDNVHKMFPFIAGSHKNYNLC
jgi:hypothetical protein|tara:strand:+ start:321 stop:686 length:366 start_codon:yes stop_codon:yes gene_type:complete